MENTRKNHFVPEWYQKGFADERSGQLCHLTRREIDLKNGNFKTIYSKKWQSFAQRFYGIDLYSTIFGTEINDEIERKLFGPIDENGSTAVRAFLTDDQSLWHQNFQAFFTYLDAQKLRTPKGLDWIQSKYPKLSQLQLMMEMQSLRSMHSTLWSEGSRELVTAHNSEIKFIVSDHPVTVYNYACPPGSNLCRYPNDPDITLKGTQTIFPLDKNRCLILANLEYCQVPNDVNPLEQRTNAARFRQSMVNTIEFINTRNLAPEEVVSVNHIIKSRCQSSIAAGREEWLYPEDELDCEWADLKKVLLPPSSQIHKFGGEIYSQSSDGTFHYQDAFGRTSPASNYLTKDADESKIRRNDYCGCGSGKKYKNCCRNFNNDLRTSWAVLSIRERNLIFCNYLRNVTGLDNGKTWLDVRRELSIEQVLNIYAFYSQLWPLDTDIYALLPKSDGRYRGLYSGAIDVRVIGNHALPMSSVFDELLIESPFVNPNCLNPDFSPLKTPEKYKYQVMKDTLFMLELEPYIRSGLVNLFPDPCDFDSYLMRSLLDLSNQRRSDKSRICKQDRELGSMLFTQDMLNTITILPNDAKLQFLMEEFGLPKIAATKVIEDLTNDAEASPLGMLQNSGEGDEGQLIQSRMGPNFEMSLFIAQATGSILVTDSCTRWEEVEKTQNRQKGIAIHPWSEATRQLNSLPIDQQLLRTYNKSQHCFALIRNVLKEVDQMVVSNDRDSEGFERVTNMVSNINDDLNQYLGSFESCSFKALSPEGGFSDSAVQRLLALSSCLNYDHQVRSIYGVGLGPLS